MSMDEVCAKHFICDAVQETSTRDNDNNVYLPSNDGTRPSYYRYCSSLGYKACPTATGNIEVTWQGSNINQTKPAVISIHTYHKFWCLHYPKLKMSSISKHICPECYKYANRKKCSLTPDKLFQWQQDSTKPAFSKTGYINEDDEAHLDSTKNHHKASTKAKPLADGEWGMQQHCQGEVLKDYSRNG